MASRRTPNLADRLVTPLEVYRSRREFLRDAGLFGVALAGIPLTACMREVEQAGGAVAATPGETPPPGRLAAIEGLEPTSYAVDDKLTSYEDVTTYNNYYEFGTGKGDPARFAHTLEPRPWEVEVAGLCAKPGVVDLDDLLGGLTPEERVYRHRCVEAWSMVVPWAGVPLGPVLERFEPAPEARFVQFTTLWDTDQMPRTKGPFQPLVWPYVEGLRLDEAMHPLSFLAMGLYGEVLPNQNGAPLRLVVPWKYGFKGAKSIVKIEFVDAMPLTSWVRANAREYGFYSNVNPEVDHPRWSQARERVIGGFGRRRTEMFNGYDVGSLYTGIDLKKNY